MGNVGQIQMENAFTINMETHLTVTMELEECGLTTFTLLVRMRFSFILIPLVYALLTVCLSVCL